MISDVKDTRWYGRRQSHKLRPGRQALVDTLLPKIAIPLPSQGESLDIAALFSMPVEQLWLEIGFGGGEHLAAQAVNHPAVGIIGVEPFINGVASLLAHIDKDILDNVRIYGDDVRQIIDAIPNDSLDRVFILFPDPWPKKRHNRRRIISMELLDSLARIMKDNAELRFASDHMDYASWTLERATRHQDFQWNALSKDDWQTPPDGWVTTRYEAKGRKKGDIPAYFTFVRRPRT